jgi:hypothetical protein
MSEEARSAEARARAEQALVWLLDGLEGTEIAPIVLGGLVPEILTGGVELGAPAHLGTTDVDVLLVTHIDRDEDLGAVERSLEGLGFAPLDRFWRWAGAVGEWRVKIEFLCDLPDRAEEKDVPLGGCERLVAWNLRGTGYVARDWTWRELRSTSTAGEPLTVRARFAGLSGYLLSKCVAARTRAAAKDFYDLAYVLIHNSAGGPTQAAERLRTGELADALPGLRATLGEIEARFGRPTDYAPTCFAAEMLRVDPELEEATLRADAVVAVAEFVETLLASPT